MSTLTALDWPTLLATPKTRWYLDCESWGTAQCAWRDDCDNAVMAFVEYQIGGLPYDPHDTGLSCADLVCAAHLPDLIEDVTGEPLVAETVVEVGVDPAFLRLTGVDPAFVEAEFNSHAMGCGQ